MSPKGRNIISLLVFTCLRCFIMRPKKKETKNFFFFCLDTRFKIFLKSVEPTLVSSNQNFQTGPPKNHQLTAMFNNDKTNFIEN